MENCFIVGNYSIIVTFVIGDLLYKLLALLLLTAQLNSFDNNNISLAFQVSSKLKRKTEVKTTWNKKEYLAESCFNFISSQCGKQIVISVIGSLVISLVFPPLSVFPCVLESNFHNFQDVLVSLYRLKLN